MTTIVRLATKDLQDLETFFKRTITHTFNKNKIDDQPAIEEEINSKINLAKEDVSSNGDKAYFLLAKKDGKIVGSVALSDPNDIIKNHINLEPNTPEISAVLVDPDLQRQGIGSQLFKEIVKVLQQKNIDTYCLDAGYTSSQPYWVRKIGPPTKNLEDFWAKGAHHLIWVGKTKEIC